MVVLCGDVEGVVRLDLDAPLFWGLVDAPEGFAGCFVAVADVGFFMGKSATTGSCSVVFPIAGSFSFFTRRESMRNRMRRAAIVAITANVIACLIHA